MELRTASMIMSNEDKGLIRFWSLSNNCWTLWGTVWGHGKQVFRSHTVLSLPPHAFLTVPLFDRRQPSTLLPAGLQGHFYSASATQVVWNQEHGLTFTGGLTLAWDFCLKRTKTTQKQNWKSLSRFLCSVFSLEKCTFTHCRYTSTLQHNLLLRLPYLWTLSQGGRCLETLSGRCIQFSLWIPFQPLTFRCNYCTWLADV